MSEDKPADAPLSKIKNAFGVDSSSMEEGKWFTAAQLLKLAGLPQQPGLDFALKLRSIGSRASIACRTKLMERYGVTGDLNTPQDTLQSMLIDQIAESIIVDWRGIDVPFSADLARALIADPDMIILRGAIANVADDMNKWRVQSTSDAVKN